MTSTCQEFVSCNFLRTIVLKMHSINALENKSITAWSLTRWVTILFSLMMSQESERGRVIIQYHCCQHCAPVWRLMLGFIMAKEINSFLSPPVWLAARVKSHQPLINEPSLGLHAKPPKNGSPGDVTIFWQTSGNYPPISTAARAHTHTHVQTHRQAAVVS